MSLNCLVNFGQFSLYRIILTYQDPSLTLLPLPGKIGIYLLTMIISGRVVRSVGYLLCLIFSDFEKFQNNIIFYN